MCGGERGYAICPRRGSSSVLGGSFDGRSRSDDAGVTIFSVCMCWTLGGGGSIGMRES